MLDIQMTFSKRSTPTQRYHICQAHGQTWDSVFSTESLRQAKVLAGLRQEKDPQRDYRIVDRKHGVEVAF